MPGPESSLPSLQSGKSFSSAMKSWWYSSASYHMHLTAETQLAEVETRLEDALVAGDPTGALQKLTEAMSDLRNEKETPRPSAHPNPNPNPNPNPAAL